MLTPLSAAGRMGGVLYCAAVAATDLSGASVAPRARATIWSSLFLSPGTNTVRILVAYAAL